MKIVEVSAAIIIKDNKILITQRGYGEYKDFWEFPGGKLEKDETGETAIIREMKEELDADIEVIKYLSTIEHDYPSFHLIMHNYLCRFKNNYIKLLEHESMKYVSIEELDSIDFLPADRKIISSIKKLNNFNYLYNK